MPMGYEAVSMKQTGSIRFSFSNQHIQEMFCLFVATILIVATTVASFDYTKQQQLELFSAVKEVKQFVFEGIDEGVTLSLFFLHGSLLLAREYRADAKFNFAFVHENFLLSPLVLSDYHIGRSPPSFS